MSNDKAEILTEAEVARYMTFPYLLEGGTGERALSTIRQMAGLLAEHRGRIESMGCLHSQCDGKVILCDLCERTQSLLARYKGERTS